MRRILADTLLRGLLPAALLAACATPALADVIAPFAVDGSFTNGSPISGQLLIDTTTGTAVAADIFVGAPANQELTSIVYSLQGFGTYVVEVTGTGAAHSSTNALYLEFMATSLVGFTGGALYTAPPPSGSALQISDYQGPTYQLFLNPLVVTPVPEPATLALLGLALPVLGVLRHGRGRA